MIYTRYLSHPNATGFIFELFVGYSRLRILCLRFIITCSYRYWEVATTCSGITKFTTHKAIAIRTSVKSNAILYNLYNKLPKHVPTIVKNFTSIFPPKRIWTFFTGKFPSFFPLATYVSFISFSTYKTARNYVRQDSLCRCFWYLKFNGASYLVQRTPYMKIEIITFSRAFEQLLYWAKKKKNEKRAIRNISFLMSYNFQTFSRETPESFQFYIL